MLISQAHRIWSFEFSTHLRYPWPFLRLPRPFSVILLLPRDRLSKFLIVHPSFPTPGSSNSSSYLPLPTFFPRVVIALCYGQGQFHTSLVTS